MPKTDDKQRPRQLLLHFRRRNYILVLFALLLPMRIWAVDEKDFSAPSSDLVLARYAAALEQNSQRMASRTVVVDIEASLPRLAKQGRLQAIRRLVPLDRPQYQVLRTEGDRMVRQQVIARYLSAEAQAQTIPASSVAVSMANYRFHYVCSIGSGKTLTYVYKITPRKKRIGLIRGELWIDARTGFAIHEAGFLIKQPSMFLRRTEMVQDTDLREGVPYRRITRLGIDTRLVGRAELTIKEHPELAAYSNSPAYEEADTSDASDAR